MKRVTRGLGACAALVAGMLTVFNVAYADASFPDTRVLGVEVGAAKVQGDTLFERDHTSNDVEFGIRIGTQSKEWRALLVGSFYDNGDDDQQYFKAVAQFDYFVMQDEMHWKPYIGLNLGYISYSTTSLDTTGFLYGGEVGLQYRINQNIAVDATYRYSFASKDTIDHAEAFVIGIDYLY